MVAEENLNRQASVAETVISPLRSDLRIIEDNSSGKEKSWIIFDPINGKYFRIHEKEHHVISLLAKEIRLKELMEAFNATGIHITEKEILSIVNFLTLNSLLVSRYLVTENILTNRSRLKKSTIVQRSLGSLLFLRVPIWNPDKFLDRTKDTVKFLFNKWALLTLAILSAIGYICVIPQWTRLSSQFYSSLSYKGAIQYAVTIIILKVLHEFAHAYTAKLHDVSVRKFGIFFIIFFPRLYTDLTDSWQIVERKKRILIDSAGILLEVAAGGIAALIWLNTGSGTVNGTAYYVFAVSALSAILINGNPLIKYDGYYLLMDVLNVDNLQRQSVTFFRQMVYSKLFGIKIHIDRSADFPSWKRNLLVAFSIASFIYRFFLYTGIILIIYFMFTKTLAVLLILAEIYTLFVMPIHNEIKTISKFKTNMNQKKTLLSVSFVLVVVIILIVPIPWNIEAPCETASLEAVSIFAPQEGFLQNINTPNGNKVKPGEVLIVLENPFLSMDIEESQLELKILHTQRNIASAKYENLGMVKIKEEQISGIKKKLKEDFREQELLTLKAPISGVFALFDIHLKTGKWIKKGELLGEVTNPEKAIIFAYVEEQDI